jgi:hypothetical protein
LVVFFVMDLDEMGIFLVLDSDSFIELEDLISCLHEVDGHILNIKDTLLVEDP